MSIAGLEIDTSSVLLTAPSVVIFGVAGGGKTFQMASAFQNSLYIQTSQSILRAYADWCEKHPELKWKVPAHITFDENYVREHGGSWTGCLIDIMTKYLAATDAGKSPYEGIIFDEWSTLCERIFAELKTDPWGKFKGRNGNINIFAVFDAFKSIHRSALSLGRRSRKMVGFVSHAQMPKIEDDDASPNKGGIKWRGGPKMPMGLSDQSSELCSDADVVLQLEIKDNKKAVSLSLDFPSGPAAPAAPATQVTTPAPVQGNDMMNLNLSMSLSAPAAPAPAAPAAPSLSLAPAEPPPVDGQRVFYTQLDTKWFRKVRGFGVNAEEPLDIHSGKGLREILQRAGFKLSPV